MVLSFIFKEEFKMENNEFNKEEFLERMKQAAESPVPSSTLDILKQMKTYRSIAVESRKAAKVMMGMKDVMPEQLHDDLEEKIELLMDWSNGAQKAFEAIRDLLPLAQRLDVACTLTHQQLDEIIQQLEEME